MLWPLHYRLMEIETTVSSAPAADAREVLRCMQCSLVQFRTQNNLCRRCWAPLDAPVPEPVAASDAAKDDSDALPNVAEAIRSLRRQQGLSQRELAQRMQVPRTYVSKIENDKATPTIGSLERLAAAMETSVATILRCTGNAGADERIRELLSDSFIQQLVPHVVQLRPVQMNHILNEIRLMASASKTQPRAFSATVGA